MLTIFTYNLFISVHILIISASLEANNAINKIYNLYILDNNHFTYNDE